MRAINAMLSAGVASVEWRASRLSTQGLEQLETMADFIRKMEGLPPAEGSQGN